VVDSLVVPGLPGDLGRAEMRELGVLSSLGRNSSPPTSGWPVRTARNALSAAWTSR